MELLAIVYYWVRVGLVGLVALLALLFALRRSRVKTAKRDLLTGIIAIVAFVLTIIAVQPPLNFVTAAVALVLGIAIGFILGSVRPLIAWLGAILVVFAAIMVLFGEGGAAAAGLTGLAFTVGMPLGQGIRRKQTVNGATNAPSRTDSQEVRADTP